MSKTARRRQDRDHWIHRRQQQLAHCRDLDPGRLDKWSLCRCGRTGMCHVDQLIQAAPATRRALQKSEDDYA